MILGFGNNVVSSLASDLTASQTTITVMPGDGPLFAALLTSDFSNKSTNLKNYAKITLTDAGETAFEVCHLTAVTGDTLKVIRGQEGTAAKGWSLKDVISNFATRGSENNFLQVAHVQSGFYTSGTAGGTANGLTLELPTTFFLNGEDDWMLKTPIIVFPSKNNTGASTLQLTMGGRVLGTFPLYKGNKSQLDSGDLIAGVPICCLLDTTKNFFNVLNPVAAYFGKVRTVNNEGPDANGNVALTASDVGAYPVTGGEVKGEVWSGVTNNYRIISGKKGAFWRFDGNDHYLMFTNEGDPNGGWNTLRPLRANYETGDLTTNHNFSASGKVTAGNNVYSGGGASWIATDGNIHGSCWDGYLNNWIIARTSANLGAGWWRDNNTGFITQWGQVARTGDSTNISFPMTFPNTCINVQMTINNNNVGSRSTANIKAINLSQSGFQAIIYGDEGGAHWFAIGW